MVNIYDITEIRDTFQDCNINFLFGSGMSAPFFSTLGKIEQLLTEVDSRIDINDDQKKIIRVSLYKKYFDGVIFSNTDVLKFSDEITKEIISSLVEKVEAGTLLIKSEELITVLNNYETFLKTLNSILLNRRGSLLSRQVNIFTTNIDIFLEKALERVRVEYNDGFSGRFKPLFGLGNFKKSYFKRSLHYDNVSELPVFNLMKMHGSLTWEKVKDSEDILFSQKLELVDEVNKKNISSSKVIEVTKNTTITDLVAGVASKALDAPMEAFLTEYEKLSIVNPTKEKFKDTVLNQTYYELLRVFSNELEKENTILFVMGFSFADEHIRRITVRAANSNPTLKIYVFAYTDKTKIDIEAELAKSTPNNKNIIILSPQDFIKPETNEPSAEGEEPIPVKEVFLNFKNVNELVFNCLAGQVCEKEDDEQSKEATN